MNVLLTLFYIVTFIIITMGALMLAYYPLALIFELRLRRTPVFKTPSPLVSIIIPAYNEEKLIGNCVRSILKSNYRNYEIILVDDGSKDGTLKAMRRYEDPPRVQVIAQPNGGKASALNAGYQRAKGEILFFVDADGIFTPSTIREMLYGFRDQKVGAVCGNDAPINLNRLQTKLQAMQTHVGTGFVRRALAELNCLPIVSGNIGAFRRTALEQTVTDSGYPTHAGFDRLWPFLRSRKAAEPLSKGFIGEDLELTWRIYRAGYKVNFAPHAIVLAEVPSTIKGLWKQRVRWARGLLQTIRLHRDMFFNPRYGPLGVYLPINFLNMVVIPILQLLVVLLVILFAITGYSPVDLHWLNLILWFGLAGALLTVMFALAMDDAWKDLKYIYVIPLWIPYSLLMSLVMVWAILLEMRGTQAQWNKVERTGVISRTSMSETGKK
jgi:cellulose synthase/poly-beta-1,6-N-acetylglucosamine synthase-like glycosyltransferase